MPLLSLMTTREICRQLVVVVVLFHYLLYFTHLTSAKNDAGYQTASKDSSRNIEQFIKEEVDLNKDGLVSKKEIIHKIEKSFSQQRQSEVDELMVKYDINYDNKVSWKEFISASHPHEDLDYDEKKFKMADVDEDGFLDSKEFASFYFPGADNGDMVDWVMDDWLKKVDLNRDGFVTMNEFLASQSEGNPDIHEQRKLREHFNEDYDMNGDGKIDKEELKEWLAPNRASAMRGTKRILKLADNDGDGHLSMKEILENDHSISSLLHDDTDSFKDEL